MPAGRPTKYNPKLLPQIQKAYEAGFTDKEVATLLGVSEATINAWKPLHPEFLESLKAGKDKHDDEVEASLAMAAKGFEYTYETDVKIDNEIVKMEVRKYYPPNPVSGIFWLKNRRPDKWRDKQEHEIKGELALKATIGFKK